MSDEKEMDLADITHEAMSSHVGSTFKTRLFAGTSDEGIVSEGVVVDLKLIACEDLGEITCAESPETDKMVTRKRFSLTFSGPEYTYFHDGNYTLTHPELGQISHISLSKDGDKDCNQNLVTAVFS